MREIKKKRKGKRMEREEKGGDSERENIRERKREREFFLGLALLRITGGCNQWTEPEWDIQESKDGYNRQMHRHEFDLR